jgi:maltose-binding protein MalE
VKISARGLIAAVATAGLLFTGMPAQAAENEIVVWSDETRGPQLEGLLEGNKTVAPGFTVKVKYFASLSALQSAWEKATSADGPDVVVGAINFTAAAKSGRIVPLTLSSAVKRDLGNAALSSQYYKGDSYGVPLDLDTTGMLWNTKFGKAPATFGALANYYAKNKTSKKLTGGICAPGEWQSQPVITALGGGAWGYTSTGAPVPSKTDLNSAAFKANIKRYLVGANGKSNGLFKYSGCFEDFLAGKIPAANTGAWDFAKVTAAGIKFSISAVPGLTATTKGKQWVNYSGAFVTSYAKDHKVELGAKTLVGGYFASPAGQLALAKLSSRPPASAKAAAQVTNKDTKAIALAGQTGIAQFGAMLDNKASGSDWYANVAASFKAILVDGKNISTTLDKAATAVKKNFVAGAKDLR